MLGEGDCSVSVLDRRDEPRDSAPVEVLSVSPSRSRSKVVLRVGTEG